jgi:hypothetical protein
MHRQNAHRFRFSLAAVFVATAVIGLVTVGVRALVTDGSHLMLGAAVWYLGAFNMMLFAALGNAFAGARGTIFAAVVSAVLWFLALCMVESFEPIVVSLLGLHAIVVVAMTVGIIWPLIRNREPDTDGEETAHRLLEQRRRGWPPPDPTESQDPHRSK